MATLKSLSTAAAPIFLLFVAFACQSGSPSENGGEAVPGPTSTTEVSSEIGILAHRLVFAYMSDKPWGFFGATCEMWIREDYQWESSMSEQLEDGRIKVTYQRNEDRIIGPEILIFNVDIDTREVEGDNMPETDTGRMGVAEGCDQW
ncbi:MAG: hypothetical protein F4X40_05930 [Chloroflexi bacterium]|nr:hypothetical protein [Chloroflexota bacterium]